MNKIDEILEEISEHGGLGTPTQQSMQAYKTAKSQIKAEILKVLPEMKPADIHTYGSMNEQRKAYNEALLEVTAKLNELFNEKEK